MKVIEDKDLSVLYKYTQKIAKEIAKKHTDETIYEIQDLFKNNHKFGELTYSGGMTFILTIGTFYLCHLFKFSDYIGKQFPDVGHSNRDNFEEMIKGLRILLDMPEINAKEYDNGIKKINV